MPSRFSCEHLLTSPPPFLCPSLQLIHDVTTASTLGLCPGLSPYHDLQGPPHGPAAGAGAGAQPATRQLAPHSTTGPLTAAPPHALGSAASVLPPPPVMAHHLTCGWSNAGDTVAAGAGMRQGGGASGTGCREPLCAALDGVNLQPLSLTSTYGHGTMQPDAATARGKVGLYGLGRWAIGRRPDPLLQPCCHPATATLTSVQNH